MIETLGVCEVWAGFGRVGNLKRKPKNRIERGVRGILRESRIGFWEGGVAKSITSFFGSFSRLSSERARAFVWEGSGFTFHFCPTRLECPPYFLISSHTLILPDAIIHNQGLTNRELKLSIRCFGIATFFASLSNGA